MEAITTRKEQINSPLGSANPFQKQKSKSMQRNKTITIEKVREIAIKTVLKNKNQNKVGHNLEHSTIHPVLGRLEVVRSPVYWVLGSGLKVLEVSINDMGGFDTMVKHEREEEAC